MAANGTPDDIQRELAEAEATLRAAEAADATQQDRAGATDQRLSEAQAAMASAVEERRRVVASGVEGKVLEASRLAVRTTEERVAELTDLLADLQAGRQTTAARVAEARAVLESAQTRADDARSHVIAAQLAEANAVVELIWAEALHHARQSALMERWVKQAQTEARFGRHLMLDSDGRLHLPRLGAPRYC